MQTDGQVATWRIPALAAGATVQLNGTAVGEGDQLIARVASVPKDQTTDNHEVHLSIGASPAGTADLQITSVETRPSGTWSYTARVTVTNLGLSAYEDPNRPAYLHATTRPSTGIFTMSSTSLTPSWTCNGSYCTTPTPMPPGASAVFDFTLAEPPDALWFTLLTGHEVPDPNPNNNVYWVSRDY